MDGGALSNQGVHHLDLVRYLLGELTTIFGRAKTYGSKLKSRTLYRSFSGLKNNCLGSIEVTTAARPQDFCAEISILGSQGLAQIGGIAVNELQIYTPNPSSCGVYSEDFSACIWKWTF